MTSPFPLPKFYGSRTSGDPELRRAARMSRNAPRVPWDVFIREYMEWRQGEHVAIIGPTGQGKTNTLLNILPLHPFVVVFATKPHDESMDSLIQNGGYVRMERWRTEDPRITPRRVLWPDARDLNADDIQKDAFSDAFQRIYREGGWTVAIDELWYIVNVLGFSAQIKKYLLQARSLGISLVNCTQRPVSVPLEVYDQSTHLMFFRDNDRRNIDRLADINAASSGFLRETIPTLDRHQVLYINTRTGKMCRTKPPLIKMGGESA